MYRYLDRSIDRLSVTDRFLLFAIRTWAASKRAERCPCAALEALFSAHGLGRALPDFTMAMTVLEADGILPLSLRGTGSRQIADDEARLLGLFAIAREGGADRLRRAAATLVSDDAIGHLARAVDLVAFATTDLSPEPRA